MISSLVPVITIDGPSGSGKGTLTQLLADRLKWHLLDSGALYRILAYVAHDRGISLTDENAVVDLVSQLNVKFEPSHSKEPVRVFVDEKDVTQTIRKEEVGQWASKISAFPRVRAALLAFQREFRQFPGLVTDGRDMGTVVFPDAFLKLYVVASPEARAERRKRQLLAQGIDAKLTTLKEELIARDLRDKTRATSPMIPAEDAVIIDTTAMTIEAVLDHVWQLVQERLSRKI